MPQTRKLAAILAADVVGYSRLASADEDRTLTRLRALRGDLIDPAIEANHGRVVKQTGDGILVEFRSVVDAVRCAIEVQARRLLAVATPETKPEAASTPEPDQPRVLPCPCPCCGGRMIIIEVFARGQAPRHKPSPAAIVIRIDTS